MNNFMYSYVRLFLKSRELWVTSLYKELMFYQLWLFIELYTRHYVMTIILFPIEFIISYMYMNKPSVRFRSFNYWSIW